MLGYILLDSDSYGMPGGGGDVGRRVGFWQESGILGLGTGCAVGKAGGGVVKRREGGGGLGLGCRGVFSGGENAGFRRFGWLVSE